MEDSNTIAKLRDCVERVAHKQEDRDEINGDIREIIAEAKEAGFDGTMVRRMVREYRMDAEARAAFYQMQRDYRRDLGLFADTPLGEASIPKPQPFAEQTVHAPKRRGRPRKTTEEHLQNARAHLGFNDVFGDGPSGTA